VTAIALVALLHVHGCSLACAAGIVAVMEPESGLDPAAVSATGTGLAQWTGSRRRRLLAVCGAAWRDPECQVAYLAFEADELGIRARLFAARDPMTAARLFFAGFEMPGQRIPGRRLARARAVYAEARQATKPFRYSKVFAHG